MFGVARLNTLARAVSQAVSYISATGGNVSFIVDGGTTYKLHNFTTTGNSSFIVTAGGDAQYQLVGGGGGSGSNASAGSSGGSGGGGGGQVTGVLSATVTPQTYTITVGAAGIAGVSGATGGTGGSSIALGTTVVGGAGSPGSATTTATAGGAAGGGGSSFYPGGVNKTRGTGTQAGGAGANGGTGSTQRAGGGGSNLLAGTGGSAGTGGNGGTATTTTFTGTTTSLGGGGAGAGSISGTPADGVGTANSGAGANGAYSTSAAFSGNAGSAGWVGIRYPINTSVFQYLTYVTTAVSTTTSITIPTIQANDLVFFFTDASAPTTAPTAVTATGWTSVYTNATTASTAIRQQCFYKVMAGTESGTTLTCLTGANFTNSRLIVYRPNAPITTITVSTPGLQSGIAVPTAQTLSIGSLGGPYLAFAKFSSYSSSPLSTSTTSTPSRTLNQSFTEVRAFEALHDGISFVNQTVSMADSGTNAMSSFSVDLT